MQQPWQSEIVVSPKQAQNLIAEQFPELVPVSARAYGEGWDNTVIETNGGYLFRFPRREVAVELLETEIALLPKLSHRLCLSVPRPLFVGRPTREYPWPFYGHKKVLGITAISRCLTAEQRSSGARKLGEFLRMLHSIGVQEALAMGAVPDQLSRMDISLRLPKLQAYLHEVKRRGLFPQMGALSRVLESSMPEGHPVSESCVVHGDLHPGNIVVDDFGTISGVIDWGDVHIGSPAVDLAIVYSFLPRQGREAFCEAYGEAAESVWRLARFKAIYTAVNLLMYGLDTGNKVLVQGGLASLELIVDS